MIMAAEQKRFVRYEEVSKLLGISSQDIRDFAGLIGNFCMAKKLPPLNSLIINAEGRSGADWYTWAIPYRCNWEESVAECMGRFHLTRSPKVSHSNTGGMDILVYECLNN